MSSLNCDAVFVAGGFPEHTYYSRVNLNLEEKITAAPLNNIMTITGHTKLGKTVLVRKVYPKGENTIWINGGEVEELEDVWDKILTHLDGYNEVSNSDSSSINTGFGASAFFANGEVKISDISTSNQRRSMRAKNVAINLMEKHKPIVIFDDFHYLSKEVQGNIIKVFKSLIFDGLRLIIIAIPHKRYDAVMVEKEMVGRMTSIEIPSWEKGELKEIPDIGFKILGMDISRHVINEMAENALGSPHLMQKFCHSYCRGMECSTSIEDVFRLVTNDIGKPIYDKLAKGPRQRSDRKERILKNGKAVDIYGLILLALAHLKPGLETLEYEDIRRALREIAKPNSIPQMHEVARVLEKMSEIAAMDSSSVPVIDFEKDEKTLHLTDPFFAFFLRWGSMDI